MTSLPSNNLARIANFYSSKIDEHQFYLEKIVEACDESYRIFKGNLQQEDKTGISVKYGFSAYLNTIQTLKDSAGMLKKDSLSWSKIRALPYGDFIKDARNAVTHDGNPVITGWAEGRYFVPFKIVRLEPDGKRTKVVVINPPAVDVRQFCLEFSAGFANLLSETLKAIPGGDHFSMSMFDVNEVEEVFQDSLFIPDFAKQLFAEQRTQILDALRQTKAPRIEQATKKANDLAAYCTVKLRERVATAV